MFPGAGQQGGGGWPGQPSQPGQPAWPGQPGQPGQPAWPGPPGQPGQPAWPGPPGQPGQPAWPGQPGQPGQPAWPGPPSPPSQPSAPIGQPLTVPHSASLPQGVYENLLITIAGTIKPNADKITVDLSTGHDLAFHFNPRFNEGGRQVIVRNSRIGGRWGKEERDLSRFPFTRGGPFEIKILCTSREFKVAINNSHLLEYKHRITNLSSINKLNIHSDLTLTDVNMKKV